MVGSFGIWRADRGSRYRRVAAMRRLRRPARRDRQPAALYRALAAAESSTPRARRNDLQLPQQQRAPAPWTLDPAMMEMPRNRRVEWVAHKLDNDVIGVFAVFVSSVGLRRRDAAKILGRAITRGGGLLGLGATRRTIRANMLLKPATRMGIAAVYAPGTK